MTDKLPFTNLLIKSLTKRHLSDFEFELIKFLLCDNPTQDKADDIFNNLDIEKISDNKILFIGYFCKLHPDINVNKNILSKIKIVENFYMKRRMELYVHLDKLSQKYNDINEAPMLLKGSVLSYLNPKLIRTMGDIDILVSKEAYKKAPQFAKDLGYIYRIEPHSYDLHEKNSTEGALDIHKYIYMETKCEENLNIYLYKRAKKINFIERKLFIPSDEDILFISLINTARNLKNDTSLSNILYTFFDYKFILQKNKDLDWKILLKNAEITNTSVQLYFSFLFIKNILPSMVPDNLVELDDKNIKKLEEYCAKVYYNRIFLDDIRRQCRNIKFKNIFKNKNLFLKYLKIKPKYFLLKTVKNDLKIIKMIMKNRELSMDKDSFYEKAVNFLRYLIKCYYKSLGSLNKQRLIEFLFLKNPTQNDLDNFLSNWDIEVAGGNTSLFLAYFMKNNPKLKFPPYTGPRLEGLINYNRFKKIKILEQFTKIIQSINEQNIFPVATGDIALKCVNSNANTESINLIIKRADLKKVKETVLNLQKKAYVEKRCIKIPLDDDFYLKFFIKYNFDTRNKNTKKYVKHLLSNSREVQIYNNAKLLLPEIEDLLFMEFIELAKIIKFNYYLVNLLQAMTNIIYIMQNFEIDSKKVIDKARETKTGVQLKLAALFIDDIIPNFIPQEILDDNLFRHEVTDYYHITSFRTYYKEKFNEQTSLKNQISNIFSKQKEIFILLLKFVYCICFKYIFVKIMNGNLPFLRLYYRFKEWDK